MFPGQALDGLWRTASLPSGRWWHSPGLPFHSVNVQDRRSASVASNLRFPDNPRPGPFAVTLPARLPTKVRLPYSSLRAVA